MNVHTLKGICLLTLAFLSLPNVAAPLPTDAPKNQPRGEIMWVRSICVETNRYIGWPTVCRLKNGDIIAVFSGDREAHVCPWGKVQMVRSKDNGETWSKPVTLANGTIDDRDAGLVQMYDGELVLTYFTSVVYRSLISGKKFPIDHPKFWWQRHDEKISDAERKAALGYFRMASFDNGETWTKPEKMNVSHAPHGPISLQDGSLLQLGRSFADSVQGGAEHGRTVISAWKSRDSGRTWECLCPEIPATNDDHLKAMMFHEPHVVELRDGTLVGLVRYHGADGMMRQTVSKDGGYSWSIMGPTNLKGLPPHLLLLSNGKLLCTFGRRIKPDYGEFAAFSDDGGKTWDVAHEVSLAPSHSGDLGYPSSCELPGGIILSVYYQAPAPGLNPCLMATKWRMR